MSLRALRATTLGALVMGSSALAQPPALQREAAVDFELDEPVLRAGGVQFFFELADKETSPAAASPNFPTFQAFDREGRWATLPQPLHVMMTRLVYEVDRDASTFTEARATDVVAMNDIARGYGITRLADGRFHASKTPANTFRITWHDADAVRAAAGSGGMASLVALGGGAALPASVVLQENTDFERVMTFRTAELSATWTAHYALGPGRTRVDVCTVSYLHTLPPFFLGGAQRVLDEAKRAAVELVQNLRAAKT